MEPPDEDPDRYLKRVAKVFSVSNRIKKLAVHRKASPSKVVKDTDDKETIVSSLCLILLT